MPEDEFVALVAGAIAAGTFLKLVLAKPRRPAADVVRVSVRAIDLRGAPMLSFVASEASRDVTQNLALGAGLARIAALVETDFAHAHLLTTGEDIERRVGRRGPARIVRRAAAPGRGAAPESARRAHDRAKRRFVDPASPFLVELGVTDATHRLVPAMARKWKQINKFVEILEHAIEASTLRDAGAVRVVDFGCGKGYLTFAVYDHLRRRFPAVEVVGVELREELVAFCTRAAERCGFAGLSFVAGDLRSVDAGAMDIMVALHACDTATDLALDLGLRAGARLLVSAPCCHKELRPQMRGPRPLAPLLRHGIHLTQEAEMVTDSLRALLLEACGYEAQVFEFVALEHTSKNKMILATRRGAGGDAAGALGRLAEVKDFYGIRKHCLETLLRRRGGFAAAGIEAPAG